MSKKQIETLYTMISDLPEEVYNQVVDYITYLRFNFYAKNDSEVKDEQDLYNQLEEARLDIENGNGIPAGDVFARIEDKYFANK